MIHRAVMPDFPLVEPERDVAFRCSRCGECCHKVERSIPLQSIEIFRIARFLRENGQPDASIEDVIMEYTDLAFLTGFGYPAFFAKTVGDTHRCVFLDGVDCTIQPVKPRACRQYPFSALPSGDGKGFDYFLVSRKKHHFESDATVNVGKWMEEYLSQEDREFALFECTAAPELGRWLKILHKIGAVQDLFLKPFIYYMYFNYDLDEPFMPQFMENVGQLKAVLIDMIWRNGPRR